MYADRFAQPKRFNPGSMGLAVGINAMVLAGLVFSAPVVERITGNGPIDIYTPREAPPPPPEPLPEPEPQPRADPAPEHIETVSDPIVDVAEPTQGPIFIDVGPTIGTLDGTGTDPVKLDPAPPPPMLIGAKVDPRYADALQPDYPPSERRAGNEGLVEVRVKIGIDGRVKEVRRVSAASDAFFETTRRQALRSWRFTPATRGGVPEESWKTMSIRFVLRD